MSGADFIDAGGKGRHDWWRTLTVLAITVGATLGGALAIRGAVLPSMQDRLGDAPEIVRSAALALMAGAIFAVAMVALFICVRWLHQRSIHSLLTSASRFRWSHLLIGLGISAGLVGVSTWWLDPASMKSFADVPLSTLALCGVAMLVGFAIQAPAEEILFRGYLLQVARRGFRSRWAAALLSGTLFALAHLGYGLESAAFSLASAVAATLFVVLLGGLEFSMGAHIGNNLIIAFLFQDLSNANAPSAAGFDWRALGVSIGVLVVEVLIVLWLRQRGRSRAVSPAAP